MDNGWTISSSGYSGDSLLKGNGEQSFYMSKDGKRINVSAYNLSGNAKAIHDCKIGEITCESGNGPDFKIAKGITSASSFDEIQTAFGSPNEQHSGEGYQRIQYYQEDSDMAGVKIYIYEDTRYSSVTIRNYVKTAEDNTETNTDVPSYLSQYTAPTELGNDIFAGKISVDNSVYQIPSSLSAFLDDGWQLSRKPGSVVAGGADYVKAAKDGKTLELYIINYAKYQTTPENCAVYKVSVYEENGVGAILPCAGKAITIGMTQSELESILPESFDNYAGTYSTNYTYSEYKERDFSLSITVDNETGLVSGISVTCRTWDYS